jgi:hypothetical protein
VKYPRHIQILMEADKAAERGDMAEYVRLREEQLQLVAAAPAGQTLAEQLVGGGEPEEATLDSLEARLQRLDARRVKQAPGQLGFDLGAGGEGTGQPCGESFISQAYTCRKGQGEAAAAKPKAFVSMEDRIMAATDKHVVKPQDYERWLSLLESAEGEAGEHARTLREFIDRSGTTILLGPGGTASAALYTGERAARLGQALKDGIALYSQLPHSQEVAENIRWAKRMVDQGWAEAAANGSPGAAKELHRSLSIRNNSTGGQSVTGTPIIALATNSTGMYPPKRDPSPEEKKAARDSIAATASMWNPRGLKDEAQGLLVAGIDSPAQRQVVFLQLEDSMPAAAVLAYRRARRTEPGGKAWSFAAGHGVRGTPGHFLGVFIHELGHKVHEISGEPFANDTSIKGWEAPATRYGDANNNEKFAEAFSAYILAPETMKITHPQAYEWVGNAMRDAMGKLRKIKP